jgi:hypothetical protein
MMELQSVLQTEQVSLPAVSQAAPNRAWWRRPDHLLAVVATTLIVFLHVCFTPNVGGLWRDEVNTVNLATLPTWHDVWEFHNQDSFPLLFASTVRIWSGFFGSGDDSIRLLGLIIGLALVAAFWINARLMGLPFPFWTLALAGANPMIIRYGDSARGYGLSLIFLLLMFGFIWSLCQGLEWRRFVIAMVTAVVGVHATYYNAVLLFALCAGGCFVALREQNWRTALAIVGVGAAAAISLLPYVPTFLHANDWNFLVQYPFTIALMWKQISEVIGSPFFIGIVIWSLLAFAALITAALAMFRGDMDQAMPPRRSVASFCGVSLLVGIVSYAWFLKLLNYHTIPWYYLSLVTFVAACIDPILSPKNARLHRLLRAGAAALFLAWTAVPTARIIAARHTNLDLVAHELESLAQPEDLIVLTHWQCGVTLQRYYKGRTPWMTIPPLTDFRFQSHQPIIARMRAEAPLQPIFAQAERAMRSGHRVWVVGGAPLLRPGQAPPFLPRVGNGNSGWRGSEAFYTVWGMQTMYFLQQHVIRAQSVTFPDTGPVGPFEDFGVSVFTGWK